MSKHRHRLLDRKWLFLRSLFTILRVVMVVCGITLFAVGAWNEDFILLYAAGACLALLMLLQLFHIMESNEIICPLCRSQILKSRRCTKHRNAKKLFGSYMLRVAFQVVFTNRFRCQFCDETYHWRGRHRKHPNNT